MPKPASKLRELLGWASLACLVIGGVLWALSPLGVELSALKFKTPDVFWRLFPSSPALLLAGLVGLYLWNAREGSRVGRVGVWISILGSVLVVVGNVGLYHLGVDDAFIMSAPAYRAFRLGLLLLAAGALLFGVVGTRSGNLPTWVGLPFALSSLAGLLAVVQDLGSFGGALWAVFGAGWAWLGLAIFADSLQGEGKRAGHPRPSAKEHRTGEADSAG